MTNVVALAKELDLVRANLNSRPWIQGSFQDGQAVCAHGAVQTCKGLQPGDQQIIQAVMTRQGLTFDFNDEPGRTKAEVEAKFAQIEVTDVALADTFGPNWRKIVWLTRRAAALTADEARRLAAARSAARSAVESAAWYAARYATWSAAEYAAWSAAWDAPWSAARAAAGSAAESAAGYAARSAAWSAAEYAARAVVVEDLVGQHGLEQHHIDTLCGPWLSVIGEVGEVSE